LLTFYRGHWILTFSTDRRWTSEITERASAEILPTCVSVDLAEGLQTCIETAKRLIDMYLQCPTRR
jgi:hypothetical protein